MNPFAYHASDELSAALREHKQLAREHHAPVDEWNAANPDRTIIWLSDGFSTDQRPGGFKDGTGDVPPGLSRARSRSYLIATRTKAGRPWREVLARMVPPSLEQVFRRFDVPSSAHGRATQTGGWYISPTRWLDGGDRGVFVANQYELGTGMFNGEGIGDHLTPAKLSEFYAVQEALSAERERAS